VGVGRTVEKNLIGKDARTVTRKPVAGVKAWQVTRKEHGEIVLLLQNETNGHRKTIASNQLKENEKREGEGKDLVHSSATKKNEITVSMVSTRYGEVNEK